MKKPHIKTLTLILLIFTAITCAFFSACGDEGESPNSGHEQGQGKTDPTHTEHEYQTVIVPPKCDEQGYTLHICSCGDSFKDEYVDPTGHEFGATTYVWEDDLCTATRYCLKDNSHYERELAKGEFIIDTEGSCSQAEKGHYHAVFLNPEFIEQVTEENSVIGELKDHLYEKGVCSECGAYKLSDELEYTLINGNTEYAVSGIGTCIDDYLNIPDTHKGKPITAIKDGAFSERSFIQTVNLPDSIREIGDRAFYLCNNLESVNTSKNLTKIGEDAFYGCYSLQKLSLYDNLTEVGRNAFYWCDALQFNEDGNGLYLGNDETGTLVLVKATSNDITDLQVNDNCKIIYESAFTDCSSLESVRLSENLISINEGAFANCAIRELDIPDSVVSIKYGAFNGCHSLETVNMGNGVKLLSDYAFANCGFTNFTVSDSVETIGNSAFLWCRNLETFNVGNGVKEIKDFAFSTCDMLTEITLGDSVQYIEPQAFEKCYSLINILVSPNNDFFTSVDGSLYSKDKTTLFFYAHGKTETDFSVPFGTQKINDYAFADCCNIVNVDLPFTLTEIGNYVFNNCQFMKTVTLNEGLQVIGERAFNNCYALEGIVLPSTLTTIYDCAFYWCSNIDEITVPKSLTEIHGQVFGGCGELATINVESDNPVYKSVDGNLYSKDGKTLIAYAIGKNDQTFTIPETVNSVNANAFVGCGSLRTLNVHDGITDFDTLSLYAVDGLIYNEYKNGLYLGNEENPYLVLAVDSTPDGIVSTTTCTAHKDCKIILNGAFALCISLNDFTAGDSLEYIGQQAFHNCWSLKSVVLKNNLKRIGKEAFSCCSMLNDITFNGTVEEWQAIEKGESWNTGAPAKTVHCTDGDAVI